MKTDVLNYAVLAYRYNRACAELLTHPFAKLYAKLATVILGGAHDVECSGESTTIPVSYDMIINGALFYEATVGRIAAWKPNTELVIADLTNSQKQASPNHHVIGALLGALEVHRPSVRVLRLALLLPNALVEDDMVADAIRPHLDRGTLMVIADDGSSLGCSDDVRDQLAENYQEWLNSSRPSALHLLNRKLIRYPGHFKRYVNGQHSHCVEFFFDGGLCQKELVELIWKYIEGRQLMPKHFDLFFHSTISHWLERAVKGVAARAGIVGMNITHAIEDEAYQFSGDVVLVVPLIDTHATIRDIIRHIRKRSKQSKIHVLSVLSTAGAENGSKTETMLVDDEHVQITFLASVQQVRHERGCCPLCAVHAAANDPSHPDPYLTLSAQAFWTVVHQVGFGVEKNVPSEYRGTVGMIPQFDQLDHTNGAYLAYKLNKLIQTFGDQLSSEPVIFCPDEGGATALADCLVAVFNMTIIAVPKTAVELVCRRDEPKGDVLAMLQQDFGDENPGWLRSLLSLRRQHAIVDEQLLGPKARKVIVLDEMSVTGNTFTDLCAFVGALGMEVLCCVSIVDFGAPKDRTSSIHKSLYRVVAPYQSRTGA